MDVFIQYSAEDILRVGIAAIVLLSGIISMVFIIWGWFLMIISGGKEEKIKIAVNHMRHAIIGIIFIVVAIFIIPKWLELVWLPGSNYVSPSAIFATIQEISGTFFRTNPGTLINNQNINTDTGINADFTDL